MSWQTKSTIAAYLLLPRTKENGGEEILLWQTVGTNGQLSLPAIELHHFEVPTRAIYRLGQQILDIDIPEDRLEHVYTIFSPSDSEDSLSHLALFFLCPILWPDRRVWEGEPRITKIDTRSKPVWYSPTETAQASFRIGALEQRFFRDYRKGKRYLELPENRELVAVIG